MSFSFKKVFSSLQSTAGSVSSVVGIDIGRSAIKIVELEQTDTAPVLKTYGEIQLGPYTDQPAGAVVEFDTEVLKKAVVDVLREAGSSATNTVLALPLSTGFVTITNITHKPDEDIASRIPVEARKIVPLPLKEVTLDWAPVGEATTNEAGNTVQAVLVVALQNDSVISYKSLLHDLDFKKQQPLELAMFSASRALYKSDRPNFVLLDLGAATAKMYIYENSTLAALHRVDGGGAEVTKKLATLLDTDFASAEEYKRTASQQGGDAVENVKRATAAVYENTLQEFRRVLQRHETSHSVTFSDVYLSGGVASTSGVDRYVSDVLQRPVMRAFPFARVGYPAFMEDLLTLYGPTFSNSLGAALRLFE